MEDRRFKEIDKVQRNKTLSGIMKMMQKMCDRGNSSFFCGNCFLLVRINVQKIF